MESKTNSFYEWINKVREASNEIERLNLRYAEYERRYLSIGGPTYDRTGGHTNDPFYVKGIMWLDKMMEVEEQAKKLQPIIDEYNSFYKSLDYRMKLILTMTLFHKPSPSKVAKILKVSRNMVYKLKEKLINYWSDR